MALTEAQKQLRAYQAQITENDVKRDCLDLLLRLGWLVLRVNSGAATQTDKQTGHQRHFKFCTWQAPAHAQQSAGVSDFLALEPSGRLWAIETKRPGKLENVSPAQADFQAAVRAGGGIAVVIDNVEMLEQEIAKKGGK